MQTALVTIKRDGKNGGFKRTNQASHDFWGRQNCSPLWAPIAHAVTLTLRHWKWKQNITKLPHVLQKLS